jgi:hypothetical protein
MPKKGKWQPFAILLGLLISVSACTPKPPDVPACEHMAQRLSTDPLTGHLLLSPSPTCLKQIGEPECGHCVFIVSGKELFLGESVGHLLKGKPWSKVRQQAVYLPAVESYAPLATYVINSCKKMGCSDDVDKFKIKLDSLNGVSGSLSNP